MFSVNSTDYDLEGALSKLRSLKRTSNKDWWSSLEVCTVGVGDKAEPKLKCKHCNAKLTVTNPSQSAKSHLTVRGCKGLRRHAAATDVAADGGGGGGSAGGSSGSGTGAAAAAAGATEAPGIAALLMGKRKRSSGMYATAEQQEKFERSLARFFFKNGISLQLTEDDDLKAAVAHVGLLPPTRHELSNKLLDAEYARVRAVDEAKLAAVGLLQLTTDGWRRRAAVRGVPLINVMALLPTGGSVFVKVLAAPGVVKNKEWIAARHLEWAALVTDGQLDRLLGMVMDNTKANM
jgi:hypothetical protein